jgi:hypothetical protein
VTRASEFCYIAETRDGRILMALLDMKPIWTLNPDDALRMTFVGQAQMRSGLGPNIGFRKVLAG